MSPSGNGFLEKLHDKLYLCPKNNLGDQKKKNTLS